MAHSKARLNVNGRRLLVQRVHEQGWKVAHAAKAMGISRQCAHHWLKRYDQHGEPIDISRASVRTDRLRVSVDTGFDAGGISNETASGRYPTASRPTDGRTETRPSR